MSQKFSATEIEKLRAEFEALPDTDDPEEQMTRQEFEEALHSMKKGKATGADGIPAEVWANSDLAKCGQTPTWPKKNCSLSCKRYG